MSGTPHETLMKHSDACSQSSASASLLFDLNYHEKMNSGEAGSLCRQLQMCYASNKRAARPFQLIMAGEGVPSDEVTQVGLQTPKLIQILERSSWHRWAGVRKMSSTAPWSEFPPEKVVYLTADSPDDLEAIDDHGGVYIIGGLVDHDDKPGMSYERASSYGLRTARLPLDRYVKVHARHAGGSPDLTTLAVVQILLLFHETGDWGLAISRCPAMRSAPLRKYVRWLAPYEELNDADRPPDILIRGDSADYEKQDLVACRGRHLKWR
mmetsp:Transcript_42790/g.96603  ORF Transcript_42790/g.96603 Transcript_42790/m.96603 type:complete len:267 (-) Transcript_42790:14-814(-)